MLAVRSLYESKPFDFIIQSSSYRPYVTQAHTVRFVSFSPTFFPDRKRRKPHFYDSRLPLFHSFPTIANTVRLVLYPAVQIPQALVQQEPTFSNLYDRIINQYYSVFGIILIWSFTAR